SETLAIRIGVNDSLVCANRWRCDRTGCAPYLCTKVRSGQVLANPFESKKVKRLVLFNWPADCSAKLFATKVSERTSIGGIGRECLQPLEMKNTAVDVIGA